MRYELYEKSFRSFFDDAAIGAAIVALDGRLIKTNKALRSMLGYSEDELTNIFFGDITHPDDRKASLAAWRQLISGKIAVYRKDKRYIHQNGSTVWGSLNAAMVCDADDHPAYIAVQIQDITTHKHTKEILQQVHAEEALRSRIAKEIHDELGQAMMAIGMELHWLIQHCPADNQTLKKKAKDMQKLIANTIEAMQRILSDLRPLILDDLGLEPALTWYIEQFQKRSGIHCTCSIELGKQHIHDYYATTIYRLVQETFTNISRHARANRLSVNISSNDDHIAAVVKDNGIGISSMAMENNGSYGLRSIRECITGLGGTFDIHGSPGKGTAVSVQLPLPPVTPDITTSGNKSHPVNMADAVL